MLRAGRFLEDRVRYLDAGSLYRKVASRSEGSSIAARALLGQARLARFQKEWKTARKIHRDLRKLNEKNRYHLGDSIALEEVQVLLQEGNAKEARKISDAAIKTYPKSKWIGRLHFLSGMASVLLDELEWANFHWGWVFKNRPDDRFFQACKFSFSIFNCGIYYPDGRLMRFEGEPTVEKILNAMRRCLIRAPRPQAWKDYERLKDQFWKED